MAQRSNSDGKAAGQTLSPRSRAANLVTTNHQEIRDWAARRGGLPSIVPTGNGRRAGAIRIDFAEGPERNLTHIGWDTWFQTFDENYLAFLYQERTATGRLSKYHRLVRRETIEGRPRTLSAGARQAA